MFFTVEAPDFSKEIVDPKEFAVFDELDLFDAEEAADEGIESQPLDKMGGEFTLDKDTLGFEGKAVQSVLASYEVVPDLANPDNINFLFMADIPRAAIYESAIIYQWAQLSPKKDQIGDLSIDCKVQVGNPDGTQAGVYKSKIEDSVSNGKALGNLGGTAHDTLKAEFIKDDIEFYKLKKSDTDFKNQVQKCLAQIKIPKADRDNRIFQEYDVKYGIRIYTDDTDKAPKILGQSSDVIPLNAPKYKTQKIDTTVGIPEDVESETKKLKEQITTIPKADLSSFGAVNQDAKLNVTMSYIAIKSTALPDILNFDFQTDMQSGIIKDNEYLVNYLQYRKKGSGDAYQEIVCANKKNDPANAKVYSYSGSTDLVGGSSALNNKKLTEAPQGHTANTSHRKGFGTDPYKTETANGVDSIKCQAQLDINSKMDA